MAMLTIDGKENQAKETEKEWRRNGGGCFLEKVSGRRRRRPGGEHTEDF
jgi:hypothetical protein